MTATTLIRGEAALVVWRLDGNLKPREIVEAVDRLHSDVDWHADFDKLVIIERGCDLSAFDLTALQALRDDLLPYIEKASRSGIVRSAIVAERGPLELVAKLWRAVNETDLPLQTEYAVFTALPPALDWLGRPDFVLTK